MRVQSVVGIRFHRGGDVAYFDASGFDLSPGDLVVVDTDRGPREGRVAIAPSQIVHSDLRGDLDPVLNVVESGN